MSDLAYWTENLFGFGGFFGIDIRAGLLKFVVAGCEEFFCSLEKMTINRGEQTIGADFVHSFGQNVLQETMDELHRGKDHGLPFVIAGVLIAKSDLTIPTGENPAIGDGDAVEVAGEVVKGLFRALESRLAVDDPWDPPYGFRKAHGWQGLAGHLRKFGSENRGKHTHVNQVVFSRCNPAGAIG